MTPKPFIIQTSTGGILHRRVGHKGRGRAERHFKVAHRLELQHGQREREGGLSSTKLAPERRRGKKTRLCARSTGTTWRFARCATGLQFSWMSVSPNCALYPCVVFGPVSGTGCVAPHPAAAGVLREICGG